MTHNHDIEKMKKIKNDIEVLKQKKTQAEGRLSTLKDNEKEVVDKIQQEYGMTVKELPTYLANEQQAILKEEKRIIGEFANLANNPLLQKYIKSSAPFTIDVIYNEIQNNLLPVKSQAEGQMKGLEKQQDDLTNTLKTDFNVNIQEAESFLTKLESDMQELELQIQKQYSEIIEDEELSALLQ